MRPRTLCGVSTLHALNRNAVCPPSTPPCVVMVWQHLRRRYWLDLHYHLPPGFHCPRHSGQERIESAHRRVDSPGLSIELGFAPGRNMEQRTRRPIQPLPALLFGVGWLRFSLILVHRLRASFRGGWTRRSGLGIGGLRRRGRCSWGFHLR